LRAAPFTLAIVLLALRTRAAMADDDRTQPHPPDTFDLEEEAFGTRGLVRMHAENVAFDPQERSIELDGDVRIDAAPFHLRSKHIKLARSKYGIEADGDGRLAFCPCLGTPLTIEFEKAIVAPPGELFLKSPKLEFYGVPVMYLPWFWMRSAEKVGVLPPELAYRGHDGMYLGDGLHLPWKERGGAKEALDLRGGAYLVGGVVADGRLMTPVGTTHVRWDRLRGDDGFSVDARGATEDVAWDADVLRGKRAVVMTSELDAAAKPYDRAAAAAQAGAGPIVAQTGMRAVTRRGGDLTTIEATGPFAALRSSGGQGVFTWDATLEGGALSQMRTMTVTYGRAELGGAAQTHAGPIALAVSARAAGDVADEDVRSGSDGAAAARVRAGLPLERMYTPGSDDDPHDRNDPVQHLIEPFIEGALLHAKGQSLLGTLPGRGIAAVNGTAPITDAGFTTTLGRWAARTAVTLGASGGLAYGDHASVLLRTRGAATTHLLGLSAESGHTKDGHAVSARARLGPAEGLRITANVAARDKIDPVLARALVDAPLEPAAGFLSSTGTTGGAALVVPWSHAVTTSVGADGDANAKELVAIRGGLDLRDRCGCVTLHANGAHRIGREGVDIWLTLDFAPDRAP
jgi:hypothetical protein